MVLLHAGTRLVLGLLPVLVFLGALVLLDSYKLVRPRRVLMMLLYGGVAAVVSFVVSRIGAEALDLDRAQIARYLAPLVEELLKAIPLVILVARRRVGFLVDAAIAGFAVGAGFAAVENTQYFVVLGPSACCCGWCGALVPRSCTAAPQPSWRFSPSCSPTATAAIAHWSTCRGCWRPWSCIRSSITSSSPPTSRRWCLLLGAAGVFCRRVPLLRVAHTGLARGRLRLGPGAFAAHPLGTDFRQPDRRLSGGAQGAASADGGGRHVVPAQAAARAVDPGQGNPADAAVRAFQWIRTRRWRRSSPSCTISSTAISATGAARHGALLPLLRP